MATSSNVVGGIFTSGFDAVGRYFDPLPNGWLPYSYIMAIPNNVTNALLKIGQCQVNGTYLFDDIELWPVLPLYSEVDGRQVGDGESLSNGNYSCNMSFAWFSANFSRSLEEHTANFSKNGWLLETNRYIIYRHGFAGLNFTNARVSVSFSQQSGELIVEASTNKLDWQEAGRFTSPIPCNSVLAKLPASLLPATNLFIRLRANGFFWVTGYNFNGDLPDNVTQATGQTWFFEQNSQNSFAVPVSVVRSPGGFVLKLELRNSGNNNQHLAIHTVVQGPGGQRQQTQPIIVPGMVTNVMSLELPFAGEGQNTASIQVEDTLLGGMILQGSLTLNVSKFADNSFGQLLPGSPESPIWWCEGNYKVFRERFLPTATNDAVEITAARNEYEPFQLVLRPGTNLSNVTVTCSSLTYLDAANVSPISSTNIEVCLVEYVPVTETYDSFGALGNYPDPLSPLTGPFNVAAQTNQPLWFTVHVPKDALAGNYLANVVIRSDTTTNSIPIRLRVYDFTLSDVTHTRAAYGLHVDSYWHGNPNTSQRLAIYELYMQNFARHRASPYFRETSFSPLWPNWSLVSGQFTHSFVDFDANMGRWLDEFNFNNYKLMHEPATLGGYARFSPEYRQLFVKLMRPIMAHLREKGWLKQAYTFWIDEAQPLQYPLVIDGMQAHLEAAPGLSRLLSVWDMNAALEGQADIWMPQLSPSNYDYVYNRWGTRNASGEEADGWWYVAGWPKAPLPNNFVDHPSISPRIRAWMAEKCGVKGELYWYTTYYWGSNSAPRNPWLQPMTKVHTGGNIGNGDGMQIYPPVKTPPSVPVVAGPINSFRWEMSREGQEDREYFWLLRELLPKVETRLGQSHPAVLEGYAARDAALALVSSGSVYEMNPEKLLAARRRLAEAIEVLNDKSPMIVRQPTSLAVQSGTTATLRFEAIGWPPPSYQWQRDGTNIPGATSQNLTLIGINASHLGEYRIIASNSFGVATSAPAQVAGYWWNTPQLLLQPENLVRKTESTGFFTVTAVSVNSLGYQWYFNNTLVVGGTNDSLVLTNLTPVQAGSYHVVVSNISGVVTSALATLTVPLLESRFTFVPTGATWRYKDTGTDLGTAWRGLGYDDSTWSSGPAQLGFGDGDEQTVVNSGTSPTNNYITTYFRHIFYNSSTNTPASVLLRILRDDGAVAYLNGSEIYRSANMPGGTINYSSLATGFWESTEVAGSAESTFFPYSKTTTTLQTGTNVLAVEVHQFNASSTDLSFDCELIGTWNEKPQILTQPMDATRRADQSVAFTVGAASTITPVKYQWYFDGNPITAATNSILTLVELMPGDAGAYSVVVSNFAGSISSTPANLTVLPRPSLQGGWAANGSGFQLNLPADSAGLTVMASTNLTDWTELLSLPPANGPVMFTDTNAMQTPYRFYRLRLD